MQGKDWKPHLPFRMLPKHLLYWILELTLNMSIRQYQSTFTKMWAQNTCLETRICRYFEIFRYRKCIFLLFDAYQICSIVMPFQSWRELVNLLPFIQLPVHVLEVFWLYIIFSYWKFIIIFCMSFCSLPHIGMPQWNGPRRHNYHRAGFWAPV